MYVFNVTEKNASIFDQHLKLQAVKASSKQFFVCSGVFCLFIKAPTQAAARGYSAGFVEQSRFILSRDQMV